MGVCLRPVLGVGLYKYLKAFIDREGLSIGLGSMFLFVLKWFVTDLLLVP